MSYPHLAECMYVEEQWSNNYGNHIDYIKCDKIAKGQFKGTDLCQEHILTIISTPNPSVDSVLAKYL